MINLILPMLAWSQIEVTSDNIKFMVEQKNSKVVASELEVQGAAKREGHQLRSFLPTIEVYSAEETFKRGTEKTKNQPAYGAEARINLFNGGKDAAQEKVNELETQKMKFQSQRVIAEEVEKARTSYWQLRYLQEKEALLTATLAVNKSNLSAALKRIQNGVATQSDRYEFEMKAVDLEREIESVKIEIQGQTELLALLIGAPESMTLKMTEKLTHDHEFEKMLAHTERDHDFLYKEKLLQSEQEVLRAKKERRQWWPKVDAYAAYNQYNEREEDYIRSKDRRESVVGVKLSMSFAQGFESQREASALQNFSQSSKLKSDFDKREIEVHKNRELNELRFLHNQVHAAEDNIERAEQYYKLTQSEYSRGVKNSPDVLSAAEKLFDRKEKRLLIIRDFQIAKSHVLSKIGK